MSSRTDLFCKKNYYVSQQVVETPAASFFLKVSVVESRFSGKTHFVGVVARLRPHTARFLHIGPFLRNHFMRHLSILKINIIRKYYLKICLNLTSCLVTGGSGGGFTGRLGEWSSMSTVNAPIEENCYKAIKINKSKKL